MRPIGPQNFHGGGEKGQLLKSAAQPRLFRVAIHIAQDRATIVLTERQARECSLKRCRDFIRQTAQQAQNRRHLRELLTRPSDGVTFIAMQKFVSDGGAGVINFPNSQEPRPDSFLGPDAISERRRTQRRERSISLTPRVNHVKITPITIT